MSVPIDTAAVQAVFAAPRSDGAFEGAQLAYLRKIGARRPILFLAFAPKAAGTYLRQAAIHAVDGALFRMTHAQGGRDGTPYLPNFLVCYLDSEAPQAVTHVHMQALTSNRHLMQAFGLRPVIMLRNIPDMLASFMDMLDTDPVARAEGLNCQVPDNFTELDHARKTDFMIDLIAPWYASYFATWKSFAESAPDEVLVLRYADFCGDPAATLHSALEHCGFTVSQSRCEAALARVWAERSSYRYNKGEEGRGREYFSQGQIGKLARMLSYYPQLESWLPELMGNGMEWEMAQAPWSHHHRASDSVSAQTPNL